MSDMTCVFSDFFWTVDINVDQNKANGLIATRQYSTTTLERKLLPSLSNIHAVV
jgi:hypothetical protein